MDRASLIWRHYRVETLASDLSTTLPYLVINYFKTLEKFIRMFDTAKWPSNTVLY